MEIQPIGIFSDNRDMKTLTKIHGGNRYGDVTSMEETDMETVSRRARVGQGLDEPILQGEGVPLSDMCLLKHIIWLKPPVGTKKGCQPPLDLEVDSHLPVSTILRYRLLMCLLYGHISVTRIMKLGY